MSIAPYTGSIAPYTGSIAPYTGSIAPYSLSRKIRWSLLYFGNIHSWICATRRLHARTSVTSYTSVNIYNFNSRLAHFNALWMEYIRSLRTGIMEEYPVMSTSQGTYVRIEQTSEAIRVTYEICRAGGGARTRIENRCFKGIVYQFTHLQVVPDLYEFLSSAEHKIYFEECGKPNSWW